MIEDEDIEIEDTQREDRHDLMMRLLMWREKHINEHNFVLILSFIIGICTAAAALILKFLIHFIQQLLTSHFNADSANYLYLIYPIIGILLAGLYVRYIVKDDISHGVTRILYAISQKKSRLKPHNMYTSVIASSITIGFGGSVGAEAPIVYTGAAIGSNIGRLFRLDQRLLMLLVGCGAAAAIAGIFNTIDRNIQGPHRRNLVYTRSTDDRYDCNFGFTFTHLVDYRSHCFLYLYRIQCRI